MVGILVLSLLPSSQSLPTTGWDKSNHVLGFATLAFLSHLAWPGRTALALAALLVYGCLIEVLQLSHLTVVRTWPMCSPMAWD